MSERRRILLTNGRLVNEGRLMEGDLLIVGDRIDRIDPSIAADQADEVIDLAGRLLLPGMIDDQVHFREPGLTHKGDLATESRAAVAGGITSFLDMPNNKPTITTWSRFREKKASAEGRCFANYGFYFGAGNDNLSEIVASPPGEACALKVFMGASTGNMLVDDPEVLEGIFSRSPLMVVTHCEYSPTIFEAEHSARERFGDDVPMHEHPNIRSVDACYQSSSFAVDLAKTHGTRLHVLHLTTAKELDLFDRGSARNKQITAEACVHHLWFDEERYDDLGTLIKCNPAIKSPDDRRALLQAVRDDVIDIVATDHAPHTLAEKGRSYFEAPAGLPLVQDALLSLLDHYKEGALSLHQIVDKTSHAVADLFHIPERGYLREGYFADLTIIDENAETERNRSSVLSKCGWSPFEGHVFRSRIDMTFVNGHLAYANNEPDPTPRGVSLIFDQSW